MEEIASARVRLFPSTHRRMKVRAAKAGMTLAEFIDFLDKKMPAKAIGK